MRPDSAFQSGNSQAVRLPAGFRLQGPEIEFSRRGDEIVLREIRTHDLTAAFRAPTQLPIDELVREDAPPQDRYGLRSRANTLETNICIYSTAAHGRHRYSNGSATRCDRARWPTAITDGELQFGLEKIRTTPGFDAALRAFARLTEMIPVVAPGEATAAHYAAFRAKLQRAGLISGNNDL